MRECSAVTAAARSESCQKSSPAISASSVARRSLSEAGSKIVREQLQLLTDGREALRGGLARCGRDHRLHASSGPRRGDLRSVALLELLPAPAPAGIVAPHLVLLVDDALLDDG